MTILIQKTIPKLCALSSIMQRPLSQVQSGAYLKTKYLPLFSFVFTFLSNLILFQAIILLHHHKKNWSSKLSSSIFSKCRPSLQERSLLFHYFALCDIFRKFTTRILAYSNIDLEMMQPLHFISQLISFSTVLQ